MSEGIRSWLRRRRSPKDFHRLWRSWCKRMVDVSIRGQVVSDCELTIDTMGRDGGTRAILTVLFKENPPSAESDEMRLLQRVFSEIPASADSGPLAWDDMIAVLKGKREVDYWRLEDEPPEMKEGDAA